MDNILVDAPPTTIEIEGQEYEVNWDWETCLRIILAFEDLGLTIAEKTMILLQNLYREKPDNIHLAIEKGIIFLDGGIERDLTDSGIRVFSFQKDARLIFAGFRQTYQMDLLTEELHWWTFLTLFLDLSPDTTFSNLVGLRKRVKDGDATKEERRMALDLGEMFKLPDLYIKSIAELEADKMFFDALGKDK